MREKAIRSPIFVRGLEATTRITVLESPPSSIAGKLAASETVGFAMGRNGSKKIEEVVNDAGAGIGVDTQGNEGREGVEGVVRI